MIKDLKLNLNNCRDISATFDEKVISIVCGKSDHFNCKAKAAASVVEDFIFKSSATYGKIADISIARIVTGSFYNYRGTNKNTVDAFLTLFKKENPSCGVFNLTLKYTFLGYGQDKISPDESREELMKKLQENIIANNKHFNIKFIDDACCINEHIDVHQNAYYGKSPEMKIYLRFEFSLNTALVNLETAKKAIKKHNMVVSTGTPQALQAFYMICNEGYKMKESVSRTKFVVENGKNSELSDTIVKEKISTAVADNKRNIYSPNVMVWITFLDRIMGVIGDEVITEDEAFETIALYATSLSNTMQIGLHLRNLENTDFENNLDDHQRLISNFATMFKYGNGIYAKMLEKYKIEKKKENIKSSDRIKILTDYVVERVMMNPIMFIRDFDVSSKEKDLLSKKGPFSQFYNNFNNLRMLNLFVYSGLPIMEVAKACAQIVQNAEDEEDDEEED